MTSTTIFYIILIATVALTLALFLYVYKTKEKPYLLLALRTLSFFLIGLLLLNPTFNKKSYKLIKPNLAVFVDNSKSMEYLNARDDISNLITKIKTDKALNDIYTLDYYAFANDIKVLDSLTFSGSQTKLSDVIHFVNKSNTKNSQSILISDGNQTLGANYRLIKPKTKLISIVVGDTTQYPDLYIDQVNVNKYSYIKNKFPIEVFSNYTGKESISTRLELYHKGTQIASKTLQFNANKDNFRTNFIVAGKQKGLQTYSLKLKPLANEKNIKNNLKKFTIDIIDNKRKIILISSITHPDIAALKRSVQSNEQLEISIKKPSDKIVWNAYQLAILYQPNATFKSVFEQLKKQQKNYLIIAGLQTNWNSLNKYQDYFSKKSTNLKEQVFPRVNTGFDVFQFKNITFQDFSPLATKFGKISVKGNQQTVLKEAINGVITDYPLLTLVEETNKVAIIDGEGIWHWRLEHFKRKQNFTDYDTFWVNMVQYLSSSKKIERLAISYEKTHYQNDIISIDANFVDENYAFDASKTLVLKLTNKATKKTKTYQFLLDNEQYKVAVDGLNAGNYSFSVGVQGTSFKKYGTFTVLDFDIEKQFTTANYNDLNQLAITSGALPYLLKNVDLALQSLKKQALKPIQQEMIRKTALVDWKWLLPIILLLFAIEWFIRKYRGMI